MAELYNKNFIKNAYKNTFEMIFNSDFLKTKKKTTFIDD